MPSFTPAWTPATPCMSQTKPVFTITKPQPRSHSRRASKSACPGSCRGRCWRKNAVWSVHLRVEGLELLRPAEQEQEDDRPVGGEGLAPRGQAAGAEKVGQGQAAQ